MEFELKTACSLLPVMDGSENVTKRLIDGIEMYADMIKLTDHHLLIKFVLKNRLSENAKLRVGSTYTSVSELVKAMRVHLLTKKSFSAIHSRIQNISQGWRSIDEYGSELEQLLTDLTISQAEGESSKYDVLKPINEKLAINKFAEGLKNSRTSTIVAARNYTSLKDAIQAAKDEESSTLSREGNVMHFSDRANYSGHRGSTRSRYQGHRGRSALGQGQGRGQLSNRYVRDQYFKYNNYRGNPDFSRGVYNTRGTSQSFRGRNFQNQSTYRGNTRVFTAQETEPVCDNAQNTEQNDELNFFRE